MDRNTLLIWLDLGLLLIAWLLVLSSYGDLPDRIPTHFNFRGEPDAWSDKSPLMFFLLPAVQTVIIVLLLVLLRYPQYYNFPQKEEIRRWPEKSRKPVYDYLKQAILIVGVILNLTFLYIQYMIIESAKSNVMDKSRLWVMIVMTFIWLPFTAYFLIKISKIVKLQRQKIAEYNSVYPG